MRPPRASRSVLRELLIAAGTAYVRKAIEHRFHVALGPRRGYDDPGYPER